MPNQYVCPVCGSSKIGKEEREKEYYCDACCSFFEEPKLIITDNEKGENTMPRKTIDKELLTKLIDENKSMPEILKETGYNRYGVASAMKRMGIKCKVHAARGGYRKKNLVKEFEETNTSRIAKNSKTKSSIIEPKVARAMLADVTALDMCIAERNMYQEKVFQLNKAIEILS